MKELRGYFVGQQDGKLTWTKMEPDVLFECCNTNAPNRRYAAGEGRAVLLKWMKDEG